MSIHHATIMHPGTAFNPFSTAFFDTPLFLLFAYFLLLQRAFDFFFGIYFICLWICILAGTIIRIGAIARLHQKVERARPHGQLGRISFLFKLLYFYSLHSFTPINVVLWVVEERIANNHHDGRLMIHLLG